MRDVGKFGFFWIMGSMVKTSKQIELHDILNESYPGPEIHCVKSGFWSVDNQDTPP